MTLHDIVLIPLNTLCMFILVSRFSHSSISFRTTIRFTFLAFSEISWQLLDRLKFGTDIRGAQRMNPLDFGNPLTFHPAPPTGQSFHLSCEISQILLDASFYTDIHGPQVMYPNDFVDPLLFLYRTMRLRLWFWVKCLNSSWMDRMKLHTDIHVPFRMYCNNFGDPQTFH